MSKKIRILVTGKNSYIGNAFCAFIQQYGDYDVERISVREGQWKKVDFSTYDVVLNVAGLAHVKETKENYDQYFLVNRDLANDLAQKAKEEGVRQYIYLSSMSVYGINTGEIFQNTQPKPSTAYGKSKLEGERLVQKLCDNDFKVTILRPPMVYGEGCKGNYQKLKKFVLKFGFFPRYENQRSMISIEKLCQNLKEQIDEPKAGIFLPQNEEYVCTFDLAAQIASENGITLKSTRFLNPLISVMIRKSATFQKVFGNLIYLESEKESESKM